MATTYDLRTSIPPLEWRGKQWHCNGQPIQAGQCWELLGSCGRWFVVRIELDECGRRLIACMNFHDVQFQHAVDVAQDRLRSISAAVRVLSYGN
jgi:hypothetical protein